jgi:hypothetical protein
MLQEVPTAQKISEEIYHFAGLLERVVWQTRRRVLEGEEVPAKEKLVSIFEPHTAIICRGKAKKRTEFREEGVDLGGRWRHRERISHTRS